MKNQSNIIVGRKPVVEALIAGTDIERIYIGKGNHGQVITDIYREAQKRKIKINEVPPQKIAQYTKYENTQGVIALKAIIEFAGLQQILEISKTKLYPTILILEQLQDTHNVGAILRTAEAAGVDGIIISKHNTAPINETVEKTSAGAASHLLIHQSANIVNVIEQLKKEGFWVVGSSLEKSQPYTSVDYKVPIALIVANEEKGIRKLTAEHCDFLVNIPMTGKIQSLNVSVATGIILYEIIRNRS